MSTLKRVSVDHLPAFPKMALLGVEHVPRIQDLVSGLPCYSDFNPISLWSWSAAGQFLVAELHGNLVVEFGDYLSQARFLSFFGINKTLETANALLEVAQRDPDLDSSLSLIPEPVVDLLRRSSNGSLLFEELPDDRDYLYNTQLYARLEGTGMRRLRQQMWRFDRAIAAFGPLEVVTGSAELMRRHADGLGALYEDWARGSTEGAGLAKSEALAFARLLRTDNRLDGQVHLVTLIAKLDGRIQWSSVCESLRRRSGDAPLCQV